MLRATAFHYSPAEQGHNLVPFPSSTCLPVSHLLNFFSVLPLSFGFQPDGTHSEESGFLWLPAESGEFASDWTLPVSVLLSGTYIILSESPPQPPHENSYAC